MCSCHFYAANLICRKAAVDGYFISPRYNILVIEYKERGEITLSRKVILDALLLALTAGIIIVKAIYEMDSAL